MTINKSSIPKTNLYNQLDMHLLIIDKRVYEQMDKDLRLAGIEFINAVNSDTHSYLIMSPINNILNTILFHIYNSPLTQENYYDPNKPTL